MKFTLDTNCIIDLEENRPNAVYIRQLIHAWNENRIELAIVAVSASENQQNGFAIPNYSEFVQKLQNVGLENATELHPIAIWDVFYWDHCIYSEEETERQSAAIRDILFPNSKPAPPEDPSENSNWRNQMCDVLVAWSHFHYKWDYLLTSDKNFHKNETALESAGVTEILFPEEAALLCRPNKSIQPTATAAVD